MRAVKRILCFGDSNTWGAIPGSTQRHPEEVRWTGILARELGISEYEVRKRGIAAYMLDHETPRP